MLARIAMAGSSQIRCFSDILLLEPSLPRRVVP
jgi:hypothetical protein